MNDGSSVVESLCTSSVGVIGRPKASETRGKTFLIKLFGHRDGPVKNTEARWAAKLTRRLPYYGNIVEKKRHEDCPASVACFWCKISHTIDAG